MKNTIVTLITLFTVILNACGQTTSAPVWTATLKVVDEKSQPVAGAQAWVSYMLTNRIMGLTDTNGIFIASHKDNTFALGFHVEKSGYYPFQTGYEMGFSNQYNASKWNPIIKITLKHIINPIPMYSRNAEIEIPVVDKPIGFDLLEYDWVAPYGKGKQSDFIFETHRRWVNRRNFNSNLKITFPNSGDGLIEADVQLKDSTGPRISEPAPLMGYVPELTRELSNTVPNGWREHSKDHNFYFRVRTVLDEKGEVKSALYGKIYGDFTIDPINSKSAFILFRYYLNPEPNSKNMEFDPKQNLFGKLPLLQRVQDP